MDIIDRILDMARKGTYFQTIYETLSGEFSDNEIGLAIQGAEVLGMFSLPGMSDARLGAFYQYDGFVWE